MSKFDEIQGLDFDAERMAKEKADREEMYNKRDYLIHRVFAQVPEGKELLDSWIKEVLINRPITREGELHDTLDLGMAIGRTNFIRDILLTCKKVEADNG